MNSAGVEGHDFARRRVRAVVSVGESDLPAVAVEQAIVRDRHSMRIAADVVDHLARSGKGAFRIHDPLDGPEVGARALPCGRIREWRQRPVEAEAPGGVLTRVKTSLAPLAASRGLDARSARPFWHISERPVAVLVRHVTQH